MVLEEPWDGHWTLPFWALTISRVTALGSCMKWPEHLMFKIEVFNALQTRFGPSKYTSLKHNPSKRNPKLKTKTSLEILRTICPSQEPTSAGHRHDEKWSYMIDSQFLTFYSKHVPYNSCTSFTRVLYFIPIPSDRRLGFEPTLQSEALKFENPSKRKLI